jgi:D-alanine-D-alanine ligase
MSSSEQKKTKIALLNGGNSGERDISNKTGSAVLKGLHDLGFSVLQFDPSAPNFANQILQHKDEILAVFNCLHGTQGEDGTMQGFLDVLELPYTHSHVLTSAIGINKYFAKIILEKYAIQTPKFKILSKDEYFNIISKGLEVMPKPYVLKPTSNGSTLGVHLFFNREDEDHFLDNVWKEWNFGEEFLLEDYIPGKELSVVVYRDNPLAVVEIVSNNENDFYDFSAKYAQGQSRHILPADSLPNATYELALHWARRAHEILSCKTVSRSDFRYNPSLGTNGLYFLEINTQPGLTETSIVPEMLAYKGISFQQLLLDLLADAGAQVRDYIRNLSGK